MQEHHIQKNILHKLVLSDHARFADIKPKGVDSNTFTYHLKQLIKDKLVVKQDDGTYTLTSLGRVAGINVKLNKKEMLEQAHSILLMCLRTEQDGWLLRKRLAQPMYHKAGFVHAEPLPNEPITLTAQRVFEERTGLHADFAPAGCGYVRLLRGDDLESFTHFTLLTSTSYTGELASVRRNGENYWENHPDFNGENMIPSMPDMVRLLDTSGGQLFFADLSYQV